MAKKHKNKKPRKDRSLKKRPSRKESKKYDNSTLDFRSVKSVAGAAHSFADAGEQ